LTDGRVGLLLARRLDGRRGVLLDLDRALPEGRMGRLRLGALTARSSTDFWMLAFALRSRG
jgi:hypothetical protein